MSFYLSMSDIQTFLACRKRWDYSSVNRRSLRHKTSARPYLEIGSAVHKGVESVLGGGMPQPADPVQAVTDYMAEQREKRITAYREQHGSEPWPMELESFDNDAEFARRLVAQYFRNYGVENPLGDQHLELLATEVNFKIPLAFLGPDFEDAFFVGTFDGIAQDSNQQIYIVENKTYSQLPDLEELPFHYQSTGYGVAWTWLTGTPPLGYLYNGIGKNLIELPKVLNNGKVSTDKRQKVTVASYMEGLRRAGEDPMDDRYTEILQYLDLREKNGDRRFFFRERFLFDSANLGHWQTEFHQIAQIMMGDPAIFRTIPFNGCGKKGADCWYSDLCKTEHTMGDVDYLLETNYKQGTYGTIEQVDSVTPTMVASVSDLLATLKR